MQPSYLVAKYVRDVFRMEPINIGIVLWANGEIATRFIGVSMDAGEARIDSRALGKRIKSHDAYAQWIEYWTTGAARSQEKRESLDEFKARMIESGKKAGNYWLVEGGVLLDELTGMQMESAADELFRFLVDAGGHASTIASDGAESASNSRFDKKCNALLKQARLTELQGFNRNHLIPCGILRDDTIDLKFSYTVANGRLKSVMQRIPYSTRETHWDYSINDALWKIESVTKNGMIENKNALFLIDQRDVYESTQKGRTLLKVFGHIGNPIDIANEDAALEVFSRIHREVS